MKKLLIVMPFILASIQASQESWSASESSLSDADYYLRGQSPEQVFTSIELDVLYKMGLFEKNETSQPTETNHHTPEFKKVAAKFSGNSCKSTHKEAFENVMRNPNVGSLENKPNEQSHNIPEQSNSPLNRVSHDTTTELLEKVAAEIYGAWCISDHKKACEKVDFLENQSNEQSNKIIKQANRPLNRAYEQPMTQASTQPNKLSDKDVNQKWKVVRGFVIE